MAYQVEFSPSAETQLHHLEDYLAERFYPGNAERFVKRLVRACHRLALAPHRGKRLDQIRPGIRMVGFERRVSIYFKLEGEKVFILGLFFGGKLPHDLDELGDDAVEP
jgi:toxin ParE1/3/4